MDASEIGHDRATNHDVVEMCDDEVGLRDVNIDRQRGEHQARHAADGEEGNETESVKDGRFKRDVALVKRRRPVEDFDGGWNGDEKAQEREDHSGVDRLTADEHVMSPNEEAEEGAR